jgi:cytidylate kinase
MALITFTSSFGAGGEKIAQMVADQLGVEYFDDRKFQQRALSLGISNDEAKHLDEQAPGFFDRLFTNKPAIYLDLLGAVVYDVAGSGQGVIAGHGAQRFLQDFNCALHVRVHASEATRSRRLVTEQKMEQAAALALVRKMDRRMKEFVQYAFDRDWNDSSSYDMVINLDKIGPAWAAKLIVDFAGSDEVKACSYKALEEMESSSLQYRIDAALIKHHFSSLFTPILIEVTGKGKVHLSGRTHSEADRDKIAAVVRSVPGVTEVVSDIFVMPPGY